MLREVVHGPYRFAADELFRPLPRCCPARRDPSHECCADAVVHVPSGFIGTETKAAVDLPRARALLAAQHKVGA